MMPTSWKTAVLLLANVACCAIALALGERAWVAVFGLGIGVLGWIFQHELRAAEQRPCESRKRWP